MKFLTFQEFTKKSTPIAAFATEICPQKLWMGRIKATLYPKFWWMVKKLKEIFELEEFLVPPDHAKV